MEKNLNRLFLGFFERDIDKVILEIQGFPDEKHLWLTSGTVRNSAGNLCLHITGALNYFIGNILGNTNYVRHYEEEFTTKDIPKDQLISAISSAKAMVKTTFLNMSNEDFSKIYPNKLKGKEIPAYWFLVHLLTHVNYHLGQMNYIRRIITTTQN